LAPADFICPEGLVERVPTAVAFLKEAVKRVDRVKAYLQTHAKYRLQ
jgi:hypothetical protein